MRVLHIRSTLELNQSHKKCIENGHWLADEIIAAGQVLLKKAYSKMLGLQSPILGETLSFNICRGELVQILNVGLNHWITVSFKGECIEHLDVIDIMYDYVIYRLSRNGSGIYI